MLSDLALAPVLRVQRWGGRADLDDAVEAGRRAVRLLPERVPDLAPTLSNLGVALRLRFERYGNPGDLADTVATGRRAVDAAGSDDAGTAQFNLSATLRLGFYASGDCEDLDLAVEEGRRALLAISLDYRGGPSGVPRWQCPAVPVRGDGPGRKPRRSHHGRAGDSRGDYGRSPRPRAYISIAKRSRFVCQL